MSFLYLPILISIKLGLHEQERGEKKEETGWDLKTILSDKYLVWINHMSDTWITLLVVNQDEGHIVNIEISLYKNTSYNRKGRNVNMFSDKQLSSV